MTAQNGKTHGLGAVWYSFTVVSFILGVANLESRKQMPRMFFRKSFGRFTLISRIFGVTIQGMRFAV
ncbi:MAG: hypothetical protein QF805_27670, partial [Pirellulaceae bacterium]|nr:hypothetical protein [Pirellulaceae bacterium]